MLRSAGVQEASLRERRRALVARTDLRGRDFCRAYAAEADAWLHAVADRAAHGRTHRLALLAVGGYGRSELCPYSDLDLVLVHDGHADVKAVADAIWYPVWDEGVHLDHSVRSPSEVLAAAAADLRVALGLLDARLVWGEERVARPLIARARSRWQSTLGMRWVPELARQMDERRQANGDVAYLLEPELKEGHGGLRDARVLEAVAVYAPRLGDYVDLSPLDPATEVLTSVRVELHRRAARELDRLLLQEQDEVAAALDYGDADDLMTAVSEAGRMIAWTCAGAWQRQGLWEPGPRGRRFRWPGGAGRSSSPPPGPLDVEPGVVIVGGEASVAESAEIGSDSSLPFRLAAVAAERGVPVAHGSLGRLADKTPPPPDPWPPETRQALVRALSQGHAAIDPLEALDQHGLFARLVPEWTTVRHRPQRNAYHRFTVDRHLLETAANAAALRARVARPDLLLVGSLLHDIGKGSPGDHTEAGMALVEQIAPRMGFSPEDTDELVTLCRLHLLLPETATRRDLDDPMTIETVARAVGDRSTLELLWALTEADSTATGPAAWGPWKAGLVSELVARVAQHLDGTAREGASSTSPLATVAASARARATAGRAAQDYPDLLGEVRASGGPVVRLDPPRVLVAAPDRRGLLAAVAGTLALHGLDVRSADASGADGVAVEVFTVEVARGSWPDTARLRQDLEDVLSDRLPLGDQLAAKARAYAGSRRPSSPAPKVPSVVVHDDASVTSTVVEVHATDELGLLHRVTNALFECGLDVVSARVSTVGDAVVDAFYVRDARGHKVDDPDLLSHLRTAVLHAME